MAKINAVISLDPEILKKFDALVGNRKRSPKIEEFMRKYIKGRMKDKTNARRNNQRRNDDDLL